jgi:hypothetical protein
MRRILLAISATVLVICGLFVVRVIVGGDEDTWICDSGQWVKHGNPRSSMPGGTCGPSNSVSAIPTIAADNQDVIINGNLVENGSGSEWSLLYEEPGKSALKVDLKLTGESLCNLGNGFQICPSNEKDIGEAGDRVSIEGIPDGNTLTVLKLEKIRPVLE